VISGFKRHFLRRSCFTSKALSTLFSDTRFFNFKPFLFRLWIRLGPFSLTPLHRAKRSVPFFLCLAVKLQDIHSTSRRTFRRERWFCAIFFLLSVYDSSDFQTSAVLVEIKSLQPRYSCCCRLTSRSVFRAQNHRSICFFSISAFFHHSYVRSRLMLQSANSLGKSVHPRITLV
jgi:hypothetical protein